jgi:hypothetical protein
VADFRAARRAELLAEFPAEHSVVDFQAALRAGFPAALQVEHAVAPVADVRERRLT